MEEITVTSPAFQDRDMIPKKYTLEGENASPPLVWGPVPEATKSIALICDDPDAPMGTFAHWVLYNIAPDTREIPEGVRPKKTLEDIGMHGVTALGRIGYVGPRPLGGVHRYYFRLYALDTKVNLGPGSGRRRLLKAMEGHILAQGQLMGRYAR